MANNGQRIGLPEELRNGCVLYLPGDVASNTKRLADTSFYNDANLVRYYTMDDLSEKNGNTLTNSGCSATTGKFAGAYSSGSSNSSNRMYNSTNLGINGGACTITAWIKLNSTHTVSDHPLAVSEYSSSTGVLNGIGFNQENTAVQFSRLREYVVWQDATYSYSPGTSDWHFYVYTFDGSTVRGYVDGVLVTTAGAGGNGTNSGRVTGVSILANDRGGLIDQCSAQVDDVAFFTRALSDSEISSLYGQMVAFDASGSGNNGTLVNSPTVTRGGLWGYEGLKFNGTNQYVNLGNTLSLQSAMTIAVNVFMTNMSQSYVRLIAKSYSNFSFGSQYVLGVANDKIYYGLFHSGYTQTYFDTAGPIPNGRWCRICVTWDGSVMKGYIDGRDTGVSVSQTSTLNSSTNLTGIGADGSGFYPFAGIIANPYIANRAISADEIRLDYETFFTP